LTILAHCFRQPRFAGCRPIAFELVAALILGETTDFSEGQALKIRALAEFRR
jgi:hypothetical protein